MINEQDIRAIETMAYCGSNVEKLCKMFPDAEKSVIVEIWERINNRKHEDAEKEKPIISCNCS